MVEDPLGKDEAMRRGGERGFFGNIKDVFSNGSNFFGIQEAFFRVFQTVSDVAEELEGGEDGRVVRVVRGGVFKEGREKSGVAGHVFNGEGEKVVKGGGGRGG